LWSLVKPPESKQAWKGIGWSDKPCTLTLTHTTQSVCHSNALANCSLLCCYVYIAP